MADLKLAPDKLRRLADAIERKDALIRQLYLAERDVTAGDIPTIKADLKNAENEYKVALREARL